MQLQLAGGPVLSSTCSIGDAAAMARSAGLLGAGGLLQLLYSTAPAAAKRASGSRPSAGARPLPRPSRPVRGLAGLGAERAYGEELTCTAGVALGGWDMDCNVE